MHKNRKMIQAVMIIGFLILLVPAFVMAQETVKVKCEKGQSVQSALNSLSGPATLVVTGTCTENLVIKQDDVTIQGGTYYPHNSSLNTFLIQGARRVVMTGITVNGGDQYGIVVSQGASLTLDGASSPSVIHGAAPVAGLAGLVVVYGSSAFVNNTNIENNKQQGIIVSDNSNSVLSNSIIGSKTPSPPLGNGGTGILIIRSSSARIGQDRNLQVGKNWIDYNGGSGISVSRSSYVMIDTNDISHNAGDGINVEGSSATVTNSTISYSGSKGINVNNAGNARIGLTDGTLSGKNFIHHNVLEGIQSANGSDAYIYANEIHDNGSGDNRPGIGIYRATARTVGNNTIYSNSGHGIAVNQGSFFSGVGDFNINPAPSRDTITANTYSGISGWNNASLDVQSVDVTNNFQSGIVLSLQSTLRIFDATVSGNSVNGILLWDGSSVARYSSDSPRDIITGNTGYGILCHGSNLVGGQGAAGISVNNTLGQVNCPPVVVP